MSIWSLPSEKVFRVFEMCASYQSFTAAAHALGVTQSAVSQQMKMLENTLGLTLFFKQGRQIVLTPTGKKLLDAQKRAFGGIREVILDERKKKESLDVSVEVFPGFSVRWLLPRLSLFFAAHPEVNLNILTLPGDGPEASGDADLTILYTKSHKQDWLTQDRLFPVASADFIKAHHLDACPDEELPQKLMLLPLLGDSFSHADDIWVEWLKGTGLAPTPNGICRYPQSNMSLLLAELGQGIAMGRSILVRDALESGVLMQVGGIQTPSPANYVIRENQMRALSKGGHIFSNWLRKMLNDQ
ncbi:MAG: LysR family transcriptional regulator [Cohaesibacter sp.]|nr:LysR family transcriptional regulator [Cohaesibacter sp.]MCV6602733.1 LysR family transcriptional regulator [Cohaesibacter sp.]